MRFSSLSGLQGAWDMRERGGALENRMDYACWQRGGFFMMSCRGCAIAGRW
ncbi:hypothetical protein [Undibacterium sp.]|uniref:hypothetical protein n=1 Tax=Undibacterium sp. TaxID=1914977 RepID=UPI002729F19F|nr:hypothetical protein [Undibacterium sp.]